MQKEVKLLYFVHACFLEAFMRIVYYTWRWAKFWN